MGSRFEPPPPASVGSRSEIQIDLSSPLKRRNKIMVTVLLLAVATVLIGEDTRAMTFRMELINGAGEGVETHAVELKGVVGGDLHRLLETRTLAGRPTRDPWTSFSVGSTATAQGQYSSASSALHFVIHVSLFAASSYRQPERRKEGGVMWLLFLLENSTEGSN
jgi:hypothetical protein